MPVPSTPVSRREWMSHVSAPAVAATFGIGLTSLAQAASSDTPASAIPGSPGAKIYDIRRFGAVGDGANLDTVAVQAAIDACTADRGGIVLVPAGNFLIGTVELKSNVTLHLSAQGRLLGSGAQNDYHAGQGIPEGNGNIVMLSASDADNVRIEGSGTIDGNGAKFFNGRGDNTGPGQKSHDGYFQRPHLIVFHRCRNLRMENVFLTASAYHCVRILRCERVVFDGVRIHNRVNKNNDGFHFNDCRYVHIVNCDIACQDDACALFGSNQFVTITNCSFSTRWAIFRFGGGEAENITISNCLIYETYGCAIKMRCGARTRFENITFSNIVMKDVTGPISIGLDSSGRGRDDGQPTVKGVVRNIAFNGIRATVVGQGRQHGDLPFPSEFRPGETRTCITLNAVANEYLENISFTDVHIVYAGGGTREEADASVPNLAGEYFEIGTPPAYGLFARNVRGLSMQNVRFEVATADARPALFLQGVSDASINGLSAQGDLGAVALLRLRETRDVLFTATRLLSPAAAFLRIDDNTTHAIRIDGGDLSKAKTPLALAEGVSADAVTLRV